MANPILPVNGTHELQERYANKIVKVLRLKNNLRNLAGRIYEGSPAAGAVKIPVRNAEVDVVDYNVQTGAALGTSTTSYLTVLVDKNKAVNELIDGYEANAVPDNVIAQRLTSAGYRLERTMELDFIATLVAGGTTETSTVALTDSTAYDAISASVGEMLKVGVELDTIKIAISVDTQTKLLTDVKYTNTASSIGSDRVQKGVISMIRGAEVYLSNNLGADVEYIMFSTDYAQAGDEWKVMPQILPILDGNFVGASRLAGRFIYFNVLTNALGARIKKFV